MGLYKSFIILLCGVLWVFAASSFAADDDDDILLYLVEPEKTVLAPM